mmetsp:Transcript_129327/g.234957  ORF Transcript_129327/g.234957 Transcript_129327/m.234957 type:complete len:332 (+) Transcript_129327:82-1077(+)
MCRLAFRLLALACLGDARRLQREHELSAEQTQLQPRRAGAPKQLTALALLLLDPTAAWQITGTGDMSVPGARQAQRGLRSTSSPVMGRKFENNKLKFAKTMLAKAKSAGYIGKKVLMAVKQGGDDPKANPALAKVMSEARAMNVPMDVVKKNIKRGLETDTANFEELTYEAYGPGGTGLIINCLTDNKNRANSDVQTAIKKNLGKVAASGSVAFQFAKKGRLTMKDELDEEKLIDLAIEAGVEGDVSVEAPDEARGDDENVKTVVLCEPTDYGMVQSALMDAGHEVGGRLVHIPMSITSLSGEDEENFFKLVDKLEEIDDVDFVEHNGASV